MTTGARDRRIRASLLALLGLIVAFAFVSRLYMAISTPLVYDEYQWIALVDSVDLWPSNLYLPLHGDQHPPGQVYWAAIGVRIFGHNLLGYRAPSVILGSIAVVLMYLVGNLLSGPKTGLLAAFLLAANEYHIGISRLCTEKNYLTFGMLALLLSERALRQPSKRFLLGLGTAMGLGILTKQTLALWVPAFGLEILRRPETRPLWRQRALWPAVLVLLLLVSPDLFWNLTVSSSGDSSGEVGIAYQLSRLSLGTWSWAPLALYFRPLYFHRIEGAISEYASMTSIPGAIILTSAAASVWLLRSPLARFLQILGFGTLLFFCFFSSPEGEFWWADLTILPFIVLTGGVLGKLRGSWNIVGVAVLGVMMICSWNLVRTRDNYFPLEWGSPQIKVIDAYKNSQRLLIVAFRERDHLKLCSVGDLRLSSCEFYEHSLLLYQTYVLSLERRNPESALREDHVPMVSMSTMLRQDLDPRTFSEEGWPRIPSPLVPQEKAWVQAELDKFGYKPGT
jgi:4-amino-4-deoxy-L-arabinose transferase-like glycosyltransferase